MYVGMYIFPYLYLYSVLTTSKLMFWGVGGIDFLTSGLRRQGFDLGGLRMATVRSIPLVVV